MDIVHIPISIDECPGDGVQAFSRLLYQYANMIFPDKSTFNRLFQKVGYKEGESAINYIQIFLNAKF